MSYGKNDQNLQRIGGYGATTSQQMGNAARRQSGPRKGSPAWANNFLPSEGMADYIRLLAGSFQAERIDEASGQVYMEDVPWYEYTEHYHGGNKQSITCSGGIYRMADRKKAKACRGCDIWREDYEARKDIESRTGVKPQQPNRISFSSKYVFLVLDMAWFFKGYQTDDQGRVRVNQQTGKPYETWIKYNDQHHTEYLQASQNAAQNGKQLEMRHGMVQTWPLGFTQFGTLSGYADMIQKSCRSCGGQSCIHTQGWSCPTCNMPTVTTSMPPDELKKLVSKSIRCNGCGTTAYPRPILACVHCPNPVPANLYDVDMQVQTVRVNKVRQLMIPWTSQPRPIDGAFAEALKKLPDVPTKFAPTPYEDQVAKFGPPHGGMQQQPPPPQQGWGQQPQGAWGGAPQQNWQPQQPPAQGWGQPPPQQQYQPAPAWGGQQPQPQYQPAPQQYQAPQQAWGNPAPAQAWTYPAINPEEVPF